MNVVRSHLGRSHLGSFLPTRTNRFGAGYSEAISAGITAVTAITTTAISEGAKADAAKARAKASAAKAKAAKAKSAAKSRGPSPASDLPSRATMPGWILPAAGGGLVLAALAFWLMLGRRPGAPAYYPPPSYAQPRANPKRRRHRRRLK